MNNPFISVIVPSFNQGVFISNTLQSIIRQSYPDWEVVIQDGGSTDNTHEVVKTFLESDPRISFQSEKDKGFSDAVNKALLRCKGEYAIIQNSDDFFSGPEVFAEVVEYLNTYRGLYILSAPFKRVDGHFKELVTNENQPEEGFVSPMDVYMLRRTFGQSSTFFSVKRLLEIGMLNLNVDMVADTDTWIRMATYIPQGEKKIYFASNIWSCATFHLEQRSANPAKFMIGRAQMFADLVFNTKVDVSLPEKKRVATVFISDAFEYLIKRKMDTKKVEEMYKKVAGRSLPVKKKVKKELFRFGIVRKILTGPIEVDGTDHFLNFPRGKSFKWFAS